MLRLGAHNHHDLCRIQSRKDVGLVLGTCHLLQGDPGKEDPSALVRQLVINVLGQHRVPGALPVFVRFLVADEHIKGFCILGGSQDPPLDFRNLGSVLLILSVGDAV